MTRGERVRILVFSVMPALLLLVVGEVYASLAIHRDWGVRREPTSGNAYYVMHMGRLPWSHRSVTPLNSSGFPDEEFKTLPSKGDCLHVVLAGDSFVFGDGVDAEESFFGLMKRGNAVRSGRCVRLFNIAQRATTIEQQAQRIRETLSILKPDVVLLGQYQNDLSDLTKPGFVGHRAPSGRQPSNQWGDRIRKRVPVFKASLLKYLSYHAFRVMVEQDVRYDVLAKWSMFEDPSSARALEELKGTYTRMYDSLVTDLRGQGVQFGVMIFPSKFDILAQRYPEEAFFVELAQRTGVPYFSLFPALDSARTEYPFLMFDGHLNERGNRVVANALERWLFVDDHPPFAALRAASGAAPQAVATER